MLKKFLIHYLSFIGEIKKGASKVKLLSFSIIAASFTLQASEPALALRIQNNTQHNTIANTHHNVTGDNFDTSLNCINGMLIISGGVGGQRGQANVNAGNTINAALPPGVPAPGNDEISLVYDCQGANHDYHIVGSASFDPEARTHPGTLAAYLNNAGSTAVIELINPARLGYRIDFR